MKRPASVWSLALAVVSLILAWLLLRSWRQQRLEREAAETATASWLAERSSREKLQKRIAVLEAEQNGSLAEGGETGSAAAGPGAARKANEPVDLNPFLKADPEWASIHQASLMKRVALRYGDLSRYHLAPDQLARLQHLLGEQMDAPDEARDVAMQQGIDPTSPEMAKAMNTAQDEINREIKTVISDAQFSDLVNTGSESNAIAAIRNQLQMGAANDLIAAGVIALSPKQLDELAMVKLVISQTPTLAADPEAARETELAKAAEVLSAAQLQAYRQSLDDQAKLNALQNRAMEAAKKQYGNVSSFSWRSP